MGKKELNIQTVYYFRKRIVKVTRSSNPYRTVPNVIYHMQTNQYGASVAEVFDLETGKLYAVIKRNIAGRIGIVFREDISKMRV
jgi:hypothetical protein